MCRLMAMTTAGSLSPVISRHVLDRMLFASFANDIQKDGWGVSNGYSTWKSSLPYPECVPIWMTNNGVDFTTSVIGHVRKASNGTGRTIIESHPYTFNMGDNEFMVGAHNGSIVGSEFKRWEVDTPATDSFVALRLLARLVQETGDVNIDAVDRWVCEFESGSQFAFMILFRGKLHVIRGDKDMYYMRVGDGYIFNTSCLVLRTIAGYMSAIHGVESGDVTLVPRMTLNSLYASDPHIETHNITYRPKVYTQYPTVTAHSDRLPITTPPPIPVREKKEGESGNDNNDSGTNTPIGIFDIRTEETRSTAIAVTTALVTTRRRPEVQEKWSQLIKDHMPLRTNLLYYWVAQTFNYVDADLYPLSNMLSVITTDELELFRLVTHGIKEDGAEGRPFNAHSNLLLNTWGHCVKKGRDALFHHHWYGNNMFFLDPRYSTQPTPAAAAYLLGQDLASYAAVTKDAGHVAMLNMNYLERFVNF